MRPPPKDFDESALRRGGPLVPPVVRCIEFMAGNEGRGGEYSFSGSANVTLGIESACGVVGGEESFEGGRLKGGGGMALRSSSSLMIVGGMSGVVSAIAIIGTACFESVVAIIGIDCFESLRTSWFGAERASLEPPLPSSLRIDSGASLLCFFAISWISRRRNHGRNVQDEGGWRKKRIVIEATSTEIPSQTMVA